ncbi:MAG: SDR family NAD(P)-dependent oxidoreductase [Tepidisphaerales bacterium]
MTTPRTFLITGAASGIGRATARLAHAAGHAVFGIDLTPAPQVHLAADVTLESTWERAGQLCPAPDVLVHAAGVAEAGPLVDTPVEVWRRVLAVNLDSAFLAVRWFLRARRRLGSGGGDDGRSGGASPTDGGVAVLMSSAVALRPVPGAAAYCVSKAALRTLTRCAALEAAPLGARVVAITPAGVRTEMWERQEWFRQRVAEVGRDAAFAELADDTPLARLAEPDEVARAVLFLASPDARYITGSELVLDGGWSLR